MSYYCPDCGTEVTDGVKCPSCGHMDEQCSSCGDYVGNTSWFCTHCDSPRAYCPECGHQLDSDGCTECGAKRPAICESCGETVNHGAVECENCGYNPGAKTRARARKAKYAGILIPVLLISVGSVGALGSRAAGGMPVFTLTNVLFVLVWALTLLVIISGPLFLLARRWRKRSNAETVDTVPS